MEPVGWMHIGPTHLFTYVTHSFRRALSAGGYHAVDRAEAVTVRHTTFTVRHAAVIGGVLAMSRRGAPVTRRLAATSEERSGFIFLTYSYGAIFMFFFTK